MHEVGISTGHMQTQWEGSGGKRGTGDLGAEAQWTIPTDDRILASECSILKGVISEKVVAGKKGSTSKL